MPPRPPPVCRPPPATQVRGFQPRFVGSVRLVRQVRQGGCSRSAACIRVSASLKNLFVFFVYFVVSKWKRHFIFHLSSHIFPRADDKKTIFFRNCLQKKTYVILDSAGPKTAARRRAGDAGVRSIFFEKIFVFLKKARQICAFWRIKYMGRCIIFSPVFYLEKIS